MCGLAGVFSSYITKDETSQFKQLMIMASLRGWDSTGSIIVGKKNWQDPIQHRTIKQLGDPFTFFKESPFDDIHNKELSSSRAFIGHCRSATQGKITVENAHPFEIDHIVGVHNGTIHCDFDYRKQYETDSEALIKNIAVKGYKKALTDLPSGAYALVWYDMIEETVNFIRNTQRDLYIAYQKNSQTVYWSSEKLMLELMAERNSVDFSNFYLLKANTLLSFPLDSFKPLQDVSIIENIVVRPTSVVYYSGGRNLPSHNLPFKPDEKKESPNVQTESKKEEEPVKSNITHLPTNTDKKANTGTTTRSVPTTGGAKIKSYKGFRGEALSFKELEAILNNGCSWCGDPHQVGSSFRFIGIKEYLCDNCMKDDLVKEWLAYEGHVN